MIRLTILYPNIEGKKFDRGYYLNTHMPLSLELQGTAVKHVSVEFGLSGGAPGSQPPYVAICNFMYNSFDDFQTHSFFLISNGSFIGIGCNKENVLIFENKMNIFHKMSHREW